MSTAGYYTSFASVGIVIYFLRTRKGYRSLPEAINQRYGPLATLSFGDPSITLAILWNYRISGRCIAPQMCRCINRVDGVSAGLAVLFRLYQEVWSNAVVVAPWYGPLVSPQ